MITAEILHTHWLNFIVNNRTDTRIYNLYDGSTRKSRQFDNRKTSLFLGK